MKKTLLITVFVLSLILAFVAFFYSSELIFFPLFTLIFASIGLILNSSSKKKIMFILLFALFLYLLLITLWTGNLFWQSDSWKYYGSVNQMVEGGNLDVDEFGFSYPNRAFQAVIAATTILSGLGTYIILRLIAFLFSLIPIYLVYNVLKDKDIILAELSALFLIFGLGFYVTFILNSSPHALAIIFISLLLYLDIK
jgi:hypothetical protein